MARWTVPLLLLAASVFLAPSVGADPATETKQDTAATASTQRSFIPPQIILSTQKEPTFPPAAWAARYDGAVLLEMTVQKDGAVGDVKVVQCTHPRVGFEEAATAAVKEWRFEPGVENGEPVDVKTRLKLNFTRIGVGVRAQPQVSAGSFTVDSALTESTGQQVGAQVISSPASSGK
jgi:TonB family protein